MATGTHLDDPGEMVVNLVISLSLLFASLVLSLVRQRQQRAMMVVAAVYSGVGGYLRWLLWRPPVSQVVGRSVPPLSGAGGGGVRGGVDGRRWRRPQRSGCGGPRWTASGPALWGVLAFFIHFSKVFVESYMCSRHMCVKRD